MPTSVPYWVGTYPAAGAGTATGQGEGVWHVELAPDGTVRRCELAAQTPAPSFLARHPVRPVLYAANECTPTGQLTAWAIEPDGALSPIGTVSSGGGDPCHLLVHPEGRALYACNYASGSVASIALAPDGRFAARADRIEAPTALTEHEGHGAEAARQEGPHAHCATWSPSGRWVVVADLGTDELRRFVADDAGLLRADGIAHRLPAGTGPRHLAFGPHGVLYVVGELDVTLHTLRWDEATGTASTWRVDAACRTGLRSGHRVLPAHLALYGEKLLVSIRGADVIAVFDLLADGALRPAGELDTAGAWPRHFAAGVGHLVVANQTSGAVAVLARDQRAGEGDAPTGAGEPFGMPHVLARLELPSPACVLAEPPTR